MTNIYSHKSLKERYKYLLRKGRKELLSTYELNERRILKELLSQQGTQSDSRGDGTVQQTIQFNF